MSATVTRADFGKLPDGTPVDAFTLTNRHGLLARIMTFGATLVDMRVMLKDTLKIRLKYNDGTHYRMGVTDWLAWLATPTALALPPFVVIRLFKMQRARLLRKAAC